jgi:hypothetical protein
MEYLGAWGTLIHEKKLRWKISCQTPFKTLTFFIILNLIFLDQLERRHCKDTPFFRPFYIGAPKGPIL